MRVVAAPAATSPAATGRRRSVTPQTTRDASARPTCTIRELASGAAGVSPSTEALRVAVGIVQEIIETRRGAQPEEAS